MRALHGHALHQHDEHAETGKCRYGLMCNENGFLLDDGVVARLDEDTFLCHTTTGGADRIHAWMEEWLQPNGGTGRSTPPT
jgi:glycine cleavage system aminomethyltransferase T